MSHREATAPREWRRLASELEGAVAGEVRFDAGSRALYATDASNYRHVPLGVVVPADAADVRSVQAVCRAHGAPLLTRGAGTSLAGQACNAAVVLDFSKRMRRVLEIDPERRLARVEPGAVYDDVARAARRFGLTFGPDPSTHDRCTIGGMLGNNACGVRSVAHGRTADNVERLEVLTGDGVRVTAGPLGEAELRRARAAGGRVAEIHRECLRLGEAVAPLVRERYPAIPRRVSGYNLDELLPERPPHLGRALVGSEGTCATVLEATLRLVPEPAATTLVVLAYPDVFAAADDVPRLLAHAPTGLEGFDAMLVEGLRRKGLRAAERRRLPEGGGWLLVELAGASPAEARERAEALLAESARRSPAPRALHVEDPEERARFWAVRKSALGATAFVPGEPAVWPGWEDSAVPPARLGAYLRGLGTLLERYDYRGAIYGHFGDGCTHPKISFDLGSPEGVARFRAFVEEAADLVLAHGGSLSGEHGDGQARGELLERMFGAELLGAFRRFKGIWDPEGRLNPGRLVDPLPLDAGLRAGPELRLPELATEFRYPRDEGRFARATLRCVGVGACRRAEGGVMCPSYRATLEERHSTRGRARLLFEMLQGSPLRGGWRSEAVREALDLCLSCKGCLAECPVGVDVATYKAEFLAHHYRRRLRPRAAYAMGLLPVWARLASRAPRLANAALRTPGLGRAARRLGGIAPERPLPAFARVPFRRAHARRGPGATEGEPVLLWPDTFHEHFHPEVAHAAVRVLEAAGQAVELPPPGLCCGRPLYDFGMLPTARRWLRQVLDALEPALERGLPVVGLEPSCLAVFRDELPNLFPEDPRARRLRDACRTLAQQLAPRADALPLRPLGGTGLAQAHCHQQALFGTEAEGRLWARAGLEVERLDAGCCGMAGAFGFRREHHAVSLAVGELALLPRVRASPPETWLLADGFSCRTQIEHATGRRAHHLAELLDAARP